METAKGQHPVAKMLMNWPSLHTSKLIRAVVSREWTMHLRNVNLFQFAHFWVGSTSNLLGMPHVTPVNLPRFLSRMISCGRVSFYDGELTCSHRMTNLQLDLTLHFSSDFHQLHLLRLFPCSRECSVFRNRSQYCDICV